MEPVPEEYENTVATGAQQLAEGAKLVMFVADMLGNEKFELDTADGFKIEISKNADSGSVLLQEA
jgi:hypothetical protein